MFPYFLYLVLILLFAFIGKQHKWARFAAFVVSVCFMGFRVDVGRDYASYLDCFELEYYIFEPGFTLLCKYLVSHGLSAQYMFFSMALFTYAFIYKYLEDDKDIEYFPTALLLYLTSFSIICNVMRECLAAAIFLYSSLFIKKRKLIPFLLFIALGTMFHYSMLIALPFYWIATIDFEKKQYTVVYLMSFVFCFLDLETMVSFAIPYLSQYERWFGYLDSDKYTVGYFSLGLLLDMSKVIFVFYLCIRNDIHKKYPILFNLYFMSCVFFNMRIGSPLFTRLGMLFNWYSCIVIPLALYHEKIKSYKVAGTAFIILYILVTSVYYIQYDKSSYMYPYHDVFGIF